MRILSYLANKKPLLKKWLKMARESQTPEQVVGQAIKTGLVFGSALTYIAYLLIPAVNESFIMLLLTFIVLCYLMYNYHFAGVKAKISKRQKEIDKDVLFAGRYLLIKLNSGTPLINAIIEAANSYGTAEVYFKEIVKDIEMGTPIEQAISNEAEYSPSDKFRKILFQISNAMEIGIDVTEFLEATLNEIAEEQIIEIQRYGKKLNSVTLFYMLIGVVLPSLGMTLFVIVFSLANINVDMLFFGVALFFLAVIQGIFLVVYRAIRPNINI